MDKVLALLMLLLSVSPGELSELLHRMGYAKYAHEWWAEHVKDYPQYIEVVGGREWHLEWVETYSEVMRCLELLLELEDALSEILGACDTLSFRGSVPS